MKICTKCNEEKKLDCFSKNKNKKDGFHTTCKKCMSNLSKKYYKQNNQQKNKYSSDYYKNNKKEHITRTSQYIKLNPEVQKKYRDKDETKLKNKKYQKKYRENNRYKMNEYARNYSKKRRQIDPIFNLMNFLRVRTYLAFKHKKWRKEGFTEQLLGESYLNVKNHIENQFIDGMKWENHGMWHIDHIIPLSSAKNEEELIKLCHYSNLQPLWAEDNWIKSNKI
jgi:hypothetical protein